MNTIIATFNYITYTHVLIEDRCLYSLSQSYIRMLFAVKGMYVGRMVYVGIHVLRHLKEELAWAIWTNGYGLLAI